MITGGQLQSLFSRGRRNRPTHFVVSSSFARIRHAFELGGVGRDEQEAEHVGRHDRELRKESRIIC